MRLAPALLALAFAAMWLLPWPGRPNPADPVDLDDAGPLDFVTSVADQPTPAAAAAAPPCHNAAVRPLRVACLGDSNTELALGGGPTYPALLQRLLNGSGLTDVTVGNFGCSSATLMSSTSLPYNSTKQWQELLMSQPHIIIFILGTNDSKDQIWQAGAANVFHSELLFMLHQLQSLPTKPDIIMGEPLRAWKHLWNISQSTLVSEIIPLLHRVRSELSLPPMFSLQSPTIRPWMSVDSIHPNLDGRREVAAIVGRVLLHCLGAGPHPVEAPG